MFRDNKRDNILDNDRVGYKKNIYQLYNVNIYIYMNECKYI